jgi:predicted DCC family thiol-disulfide oxidoreductase YuxK
LTGPSPRKGLVLFDGVCVLCDRSMRWLLDADRRGVLSFAPLQGETAKAVRARHPGSGDSLSTVVYVRNPGSPAERVYLRSDAAAAILGDLGGGYRLLSWLRVIPRPVRDALYDWVAARRYRWFGKLDSCRLPDAGTAGRFLP